MKRFLLVIPWLLLSFSILSQNESKPIDTLLLKAIKENDFQKVRSLVNEGVDVNARDKNEASPLMWAAYKADQQMVKFLVESGANFNHKGIIDLGGGAYYGNLMGLAAGTGKLELLKYLVEFCKINVDDNELNAENGEADGWTALQLSFIILGSQT